MVLKSIRKNTFLSQVQRLLRNISSFIYSDSDGKIPALKSYLYGSNNSQRVLFGRVLSSDEPGNCLDISSDINHISVHGANNRRTLPTDDPNDAAWSGHNLLQDTNNWGGKLLQLLSPSVITFADFLSPWKVNLCRGHHSGAPENGYTCKCPTVLSFSYLTRKHLFAYFIK